MKKIFKAAPILMLVLMAATALFGYINYAGYPSDVISFFSEWKITLGSGSTVKDLINYENEDYFYNENDGIDWVVYKTPNSGGTTSNSSNTRSELRQLEEWTPETGGKLIGTLKVMQVSTTADARIPASYSVVVGQIHSSDGHENEPIKIFYKKFPGHTLGSVFWNYEINTDGDNGERWDYATAVWGDDWTVVGSSPTSYPEEPSDGIKLGEAFSYEINVYNGIMYLTFESEGHATKTFTKSLVSSDFTSYSDIPQQVLTVFSSTGQDGTEKPNAYAGELQYFKQGSYNQTNGKDPADNMIWNTGAETYNGDLADQYANGSYAEVWFKEATVGPGTEPISLGIAGNEIGNLNIYPNPTAGSVQILSPNRLIAPLQVFNLSGQCIINKPYVGGTANLLDLSALEPGNYFLVSKDAIHRKTVSKIIKQ